MTTAQRRLFAPIEKATQTGLIEEVTVMPPALVGTLADKWGSLACAEPC